jgi:hypothetical protein
LSVSNRAAVKLLDRIAHPAQINIGRVLSRKEATDLLHKIVKAVGQVR